MKGSEKDLSTRVPKMGDIYNVYFDGKDHNQRDWRPAIIVQNDIGNKYSPNIIAVPLTGAEHDKANIPTHVFLPMSDINGLAKDSIVLCEQQTPRDKKHIGQYLGTLPMNYIAEIGIACFISTPMMAYADENVIIESIKRVRQKYNINTMAVSVA